MGCRLGKVATIALQLGKDPVVALIPQSIQTLSKKRVVIHLLFHGLLYDCVQERLDFLHVSVGIRPISDHYIARLIGNKDAIGTVGDVHGVRFHHFARQCGRAEKEDVSGIKKLLSAAHIRPGPVQHFAGVADIVDDQTTAYDCAFNGKGRVVKIAIKRIGDRLIRSAGQTCAKRQNGGEKEMFHVLSSHGWDQSIMGGVPGP
mmetsp:Transcript_5335/g.8370  ORF Transcript_5335/g.8370 Transcript_5335/m.8370 type:complete len:203 (+) Transcript_5335:420-1028(+)